MNILDVIILGIVEGFTEFLPISSTAHLIITEHLLGLADTDFLKSFTIIIQSGAILSVVVIYWRRFIGDFEANKRVLVAFVPTAVVGFVLYKIIKVYLLGNVSVALWVLGVGGALLILFERWYATHGKHDDVDVASELTTVSYRDAFIIGLCQAIAVVPGVSRSAATIVSGLFLGLSRQAAVEFSFLLAVPTLIAATGYDILKNYSLFSVDQWQILVIGFLAAFLFGILGIRFLVNLSRSRSLEGFGWYRIIFAIFALAIFMSNF